MPFHVSRFLSLIFLLAQVLACGKKEDKAPETASTSAGIPGNINIKVSSSGLSITEGNLTIAAADGCECSQPGTSQGGAICGSKPDGKCYTPLALRGYFNNANLSAINLPTSSSVVRILGGGDKYHGLESVFRTGYFDLSKPVALDGDDNIQDSGGTFNNVSLNVQAIEYQFLAAGKYITARIPMVTIPVLNDSKFTGCIDAGGLGESSKYVKIYAQGVSSNAGDILVCVKATSATACKDSDFQWVDSSGALFSTRPNSPLRLTGSAAFEASKCSPGSSNPDVTWGSMPLYAQLSSNVTISAGIKEGKKTYTSGATTGNTLDLTVDFNLSNQLYVPQSVATAFASSDSSTYLSTILAAMDKILPRQVYQYNVRTSSSVNIDSDNMFQASVTLAISDKPEADDGDVEDLSKTIPKSE